jgi:hypothetical protein
MEFQPLQDQVAGKPEQGHEQLMADKTRSIASSLRAGGNRGNVSRRVRRKSNRFLPENTAIIPRVGLRCRRILTLRREAAGQPVTMTFVRDEFLDKQTAEDV